MDSRVLNKKGASLLEVIAVTFMMGVMFSVLLPNYIDRINRAKYEKTVNELTAISQASIDYFNLMGAWPDPNHWANQLVPTFIPQAQTVSPFGTPYYVTLINNMVTAYVYIPKGIVPKNLLEGSLSQVTQGNQDKIEITQTPGNELTARLRYSCDELRTRSWC